MSRRRPDDDDDDDLKDNIQESRPKPRQAPAPRPADEDQIEEERPRSRARPRKDEEDEESPRRRRDAEEEDEDRPRRGYSGMIPYKNGMALAGYYCGMLALIIILTIPLVYAMMFNSNPRLATTLSLVQLGVGGIVALLAIIFGCVGLARVSRDPSIKGTGHAIVALVLGSLEVIGLIALALFGMIAAFK